MQLDDYLSQGSDKPRNAALSAPQAGVVPKVPDLALPGSKGSAGFAFMETMDSQSPKTDSLGPSLLSSPPEEGVEVCCRPTDFVVGVIADHCYLKLKGRKLVHGMITPKDPRQYQAAFLGAAPAPVLTEPSDHPGNSSLRNGKCDPIPATTLKDEDCLLHAQNALERGNYNLFENNCNTWVSRLLQHCKLRYIFHGRALGAHPASGFAGLRPAIRIGSLEGQGTDPWQGEEYRSLLPGDEEQSEAPAIGLEILW